MIPNMPNVGMSFVKILEYVAAGEKTESSVGQDQQNQTQQ